MLATANNWCQAVKAGAGEGAADAALADMYALWMDLAEQELMDITGTAMVKEGTRGGGPRLAWKSILPERSGSQSKGSESAAWAWAEDLLRDLRRVAATGDGSLGERMGLATQLLLATKAERPRGSLHFPEDKITVVKELIEEALYIMRRGDATTAASDTAINATTMTCAEDDVTNMMHDARGKDGEEEAEDDIWNSWRTRVDSLAEYVHGHLKNLIAAEAQERSAKLREWMREGFDLGAPRWQCGQMVLCQPSPRHSSRVSGPSTRACGLLAMTREATHGTNGKLCSAYLPRSSGRRRRLLSDALPRLTTVSTCATTL